MQTLVSLVQMLVTASTADSLVAWTLALPVLLTVAADAVVQTLVSPVMLASLVLLVTVAAVQLLVLVAAEVHVYVAWLLRSVACSLVADADAARHQAVAATKHMATATLSLA